MFALYLYLWPEFSTPETDVILGLIFYAWIQLHMYCLN